MGSWPGNQDTAAHTDLLTALAGSRVAGLGWQHECAGIPRLTALAGSQVVELTVQLRGHEPVMHAAGLQLAHLRRLSIKCHAWGGLRLPGSLSHLQRLTSLELVGVVIDIRSAGAYSSGLELLPQLKEFTLATRNYYRQRTDLDIQTPLSKATNLTSLTLSTRNVAWQEAPAMPMLPALRALHLAYAPSLASSCWWSALTQLTALSLRHCGLVAVPEGVTRLPNLEALEVLEQPGNAPQPRFKAVHGVMHARPLDFRVAALEVLNLHERMCI